MLRQESCPGLNIQGVENETECEWWRLFLTTERDCLCLQRPSVYVCPYRFWC